MAKKWLIREGQRWKNEGIISAEQYEQIIALYRGESRRVGLLPALGSLLFGLGVLSFVAANWQELPQLFRLALILIIMLGFYYSGNRIYARGSETLGIALIGIGLFTFGAGIILTGQMFHMIAYHAGSIMIWGFAGILLAHLYRSRYLYTISFVIFMGAQLYSISNFNTFSYTDFILLLLGLGTYSHRTKDPYSLWFLTIGGAVQLLMLTIYMEWPFGWYFLPLLLLYTYGDSVGPSSMRNAVQLMPAAAGFIFSAVVILLSPEFDHAWLKDLRPEPFIYLPLMILTGIVSLLLKRKAGRLSSAADLVLFVPCFYGPPEPASVLYLVVMFLASLSLLFRGYTEGDGLKINIGTIAFILTTMVAYFKLTWDFMDKSLFFIIGGVLLLAMSWFLNRRRQHALREGKEG